jgi:hypothetical protein
MMRGLAPCQSFLELVVLGPETAAGQVREGLNIALTGQDHGQHRPG